MPIPIRPALRSCSTPNELEAAGATAARLLIPELVALATQPE
jgi:hypothetical protein